MANKDHPHGLTAIMSRMHDTPRLNTYVAGVTTAIFRGDVVTLKANGRVASLLTTAGAANQLGVAASYVAAGTTPAVNIGVHDDPDTIFEIQGDSTTDVAEATIVAEIGEEADIARGAGSTASGQSAFELDSSSITGTATTSAKPLQIVGHYKITDNDLSKAHVRYLVVLNRHIWEKGVVK